MILRTYALWGSDRRILIILFSTFFGVSAPCLAILVYFIRSLRYGDSPLSGCYVTESSGILFANFVLLMLFETIIMCLTIWIGIKRFRHSRNRLVHILYRDGIFYFVYIFMISMGNIIVLLAGPPQYLDLMTTLQRVVHSILSTRIILHTRASAAGSGRRRETLGPAMTDFPIFTTVVLDSTDHECTIADGQMHNYSYSLKG